MDINGNSQRIYLIKEKTMYDLKNLQNFDTTAQINGKWVPARGVNYKYDSWIERFKDAWSVFTGKADAFKWPEGQ